jgi:hypothetical protein
MHGPGTAILEQWPELPYMNDYGDQKDGPGNVPTLLEALDDPALVKTYLGEVMGKDVSATAGKSLVRMMEHFGWPTFERELSAIVAATTNATLERNVRLVEQICLARPRNKEGWAELCRTLANAAFSALEGLDQSKDNSSWGLTEANRANVLGGLARALIAMDQTDLLARLVEHVLSLPKKYPLSDVQVPALVELQPWLGRHVKQPMPALTEWLTSCREQLEELTAAEPQEPTDYRRPARFHCKCELCAELKCFLENPNEAVHHFRKREDLRRHVQWTIERDHCDADTRTEKGSSPHTLVCTKNTASYRAALKKYHEDLGDLATVKAINAALPTPPSRPRR